MNLTPSFHLTTAVSAIITAMASRFTPAMRRSGLVLAGAVVVFSALAAANTVGELSVGEIEDQLQVNIHDSG